MQVRWRILNPSQRESLDGPIGTGFLPLTIFLSNPEHELRYLLTSNVASLTFTMPQNIATTHRIDQMVDAWIKEGRFANRSEAFRAGIFALKEKLEAEAFDPEYVTIVRELDRHPGGTGEPSDEDLCEIATLARKHRRK